MSTASAYAFRNRAGGAGFAFAWESVLCHRARLGLCDELMSRAIAGYTEEVRNENGSIIGERHRYDNRLSMAVLTRLDRLADGDADIDRHRRAVSADFDDLLDCIEEGGDANAFVEARRPVPPEPVPVPVPEAPPTPQPPAGRSLRVEDENDRMASILGCLYLKGMNPFDIDLSDMHDLERIEWSGEQIMRAHYSGYFGYSEACAADRKTAAEAGESATDIDGSIAMFDHQRRVHRSRHLRRKADAALRARCATIRAEADARTSAMDEAAGAKEAGGTDAAPPAQA